MTLFQLSIALLALISTSTALRCYQGQQNSTLAVAGSATECPLTSMSCIKSVEPSLKIATRGCQQSNCTLNGMISSIGVCQNSTSYPYTTYCCCYGDGCNSALGLMTSSTQLFVALLFAIFPLVLGWFSFA